MIHCDIQLIHDTSHVISASFRESLVAYENNAFDTGHVIESAFPVIQPIFEDIFIV